MTTPKPQLCRGGGYEEVPSNSHYRAAKRRIVVDPGPNLGFRTHISGRLRQYILFQRILQVYKGLFLPPARKLTVHPSFDCDLLGFRVYRKVRHLVPRP